MTALVDALTSGQADDELRVALAADVLSGALSVSVDGQTGTLDIDLSSESLTSNLDVDIAAQTSGALTVTDDGALNINSLPSLPTGTNNIGAVDLGSLNGAATESTLSTVAAKLTNAEDGDGNAFDVNITEESVDVATQTTLSSVLTKLTNAEDSDGNAFDANMVSRVLTSAPSYSDGAWENPWLDSKGRLQVMDQNLILVGDGNSIESVLSTDHVVAEGNVKSPLSVHDTQNGTGTTTLVASSTGEKVRVMRLKVQHKDSSNSGTAVMLTIQDASTGTVLEEIPCSSYSDGTVLQAPTSGLLFETGAGNALEMTADGSVAVTVSATFVYA